MAGNTRSKVNINTEEVVDVVSPIQTESSSSSSNNGSLSVSNTTSADVVYYE